SRHRIRIHRGPLALRSDRHPARAQIFHPLIAAAVAEFQFERLTANGKTEHLVSETNSEDRLFSHQAAKRFMRVMEHGGIAWPVRKKDAVRIEREHFVSRGRRRHDRDAKTILAQPAEDI